MKNYAPQLSERQRLIAKVFCGYLVLCTLFPPFYRSFPGGGTIGLGFHFLLMPPEDGRADTAQLLFQWIPAVFVAAIAILFDGPTSSSPSPEEQELTKTRVSIDDLSQRIHKTAFDIEAERLRINEIDKRVVGIERAALLWQGLISQQIGINPNQKELS